MTALPPPDRYDNPLVKQHPIDGWTYRTNDGLNHWTGHLANALHDAGWHVMLTRRHAERQRNQEGGEPT